MTKTVTRQSQCFTGKLIVEISDGGIDYTNPDALCQQYPGEFEEFEDPREAVETAIRIAQQWKADSGKKILIDHGGTGGMTMPFDGMTLSQKNLKALRKWAKDEWEKIPKCRRCGEILGKEKYKAHDYDDEYDLCSERCAENELYDEARQEEKELKELYPDGCPDCGENWPDELRCGAECPNENCSFTYYL